MRIQKNHQLGDFVLLLTNLQSKANDKPQVQQSCKLVNLLLVSSYCCFWARALFLLFVLLSSQRAANQSCETSRELLLDRDKHGYHYDVFDGGQGKSNSNISQLKYGK